MDYRKIDNLEEFNALVSKFVTERETLKQRIRQERFGEVATERVGDNKLCNKTEGEVLDKTEFVFCRTDKTRFNLLE